MDVHSTEKGVLIPRVALTGTTDVVTVTSPTTSLLVYNMATTVGANSVIPGFYYWNGSQWVQMGTNAASNGWLLEGNVGTDASNNFLGTTDNNDLSIRTNDVEKVRITTKGQIETYNTGNSVLIGENSGENTVLNLTARSVFIGDNAGISNTMGIRNVAIGADALPANTTGVENIAIGVGALSNNNDGNGNIGIGNSAGSVTTSGTDNTAIGRDSGPSANWMSNTIAIGPFSQATAYGQAVIGNTSTSSIGGYANWSNLSDKRFKYNVKDNVPGLEFIDKLRPVTYKVDYEKLNGFLNVKLPKEYMSNGDAIHSGFLAQDVVIAANEIGYDFSGVNVPEDENLSHYSVKYAEFVVPMVKSIQELNGNIKELEGRLEELERKNAMLMEYIKEKLAE